MNRHQYFAKPENALKRADEFINIGNKSAALNLLHDVLSQRRIKTWQKSYELIMLKYIDLCVELLDHARGKDGLHQYRNLSQAQAPGSLEVVIKHYVDLAESKADAAASVAAARAEADKVKDLEAEQTPETIMLSTMTETSEKERSDREVLVPWLKFLWETYRSVLDILRSNSRLEVVYHKTAERAFNFCSKFKRKTEFRRLCEMLRTHLNNLQKTGLTPQQQAVNEKRLRGWDGWTSESIELHLQTRFKQLEVTSNLELWAEGFRTVGDIHSIMHISKKPPKAKLMATYYSRLTKIFWVSKNFLFHAHAWYKFYTLTELHNQRLTPAERTAMASQVLLAAMAIPNLNDGGGDRMFEDDLDAVKNQQMATLLGFNSDPTRKALIDELLAKKMLDVVDPKVRSLFLHLEETFQPLDMVPNVKPLLQWLSENEDLASYHDPIKKLIVLRCLRQLSSVYHTVRISFLKELLSCLELSDDELELLIVTAVKSKQATMRIDHQAKCLRFGDAALESAQMRTQLTTLATQLGKVVDMLAPREQADAEQDGEGKRATFFALVRNNMDREHHLALARKGIIERRKEAEELLEQQRQREEEQRRIVEEERRKDEAAKRKKEEEELREKIKRRKAMEELEQQKIVDFVNQHGGGKVSVKEVKDMTSEQRDNLMMETRQAAIKQRDDHEIRLKEQYKRIDYTVRAFRHEEIPLIQAREAEKAAADTEARRQRYAAAREAHRTKWEADTARKSEIAAMLTSCGQFEAEIMAERERAHQEEVNKRKQEAYNRKISRARRRKAEVEEQRQYEEEEEARRQAEAAEEQRRREEREAEQARLAAEAEERRLQREAELKERKKAEEEEAARLRAQREAERAEREKVEAEAAATRAAARAEAAANRPPPARSAGHDREPPPADDGPQWRRAPRRTDEGPAPRRSGGFEGGRPARQQLDDGPGSRRSMGGGGGGFEDGRPTRQRLDDASSSRRSMGGGGGGGFEDGRPTRQRLDDAPGSRRSMGGGGGFDRASGRDSNSSAGGGGAWRRGQKLEPRTRRPEGEEKAGDGPK